MSRLAHMCINICMHARAHVICNVAAEEYQKISVANMNQMYMHLTNYSVNKNHASYQARRPCSSCPRVCQHASFLALHVTPLFA